jgi:hypothetical protein
MATRISDARDRRRALARSAEGVPYAGRGAGLYSEVSWPPVSSVSSPRPERPTGDEEITGPRP